MRLFRILFIGSVLLLYLGCEFFREKEETTKSKKVRMFFEGDSLMCTVPFIDGKMNGNMKCYGAENQLIVESNYQLDSLHGEETIYYKNGKERISGAYLKGRRVGVWKEYYPSGILSYYRYCDSISSKITYYKKYNELGEIRESFLPILVRQIPFSNADSIKVEIDITYSEFEVSYGACLIDLDGNKETFEDTIFSAPTPLTYSFSRDIESTKLYGLFVEHDSLGNPSGEHAFTFEVEQPQ